MIVHRRSLRSVGSHHHRRRVDEGGVGRLPANRHYPAGGDGPAGSFVERTKAGPREEEPAAERIERRLGTGPERAAPRGLSRRGRLDDQEAVVGEGFGTVGGREVRGGDPILPFAVPFGAELDGGRVDRRLLAEPHDPDLRIALGPCRPGGRRGRQGGGSHDHRRSGQAGAEQARLRHQVTGPTLSSELRSM